jgi:small GTP-binding protein
MSKPQKNRYQFKACVIGDPAVGKTSLISKFTQSSFKEEYIRTIGAQFTTFEREIDEDLIKLLIWDIAGQRDFDFLRPSFFNNSKAAVIVFSLEENEHGRNSFNNILNWHKDVQKYCGNIPVIIFGNKVDLIDESGVDISTIGEIVDQNGFIDYFITSARTGQGVEKAFTKLIKILYEKYKVLEE